MYWHLNIIATNGIWHRAVKEMRNMCGYDKQPQPFHSKDLDVSSIYISYLCIHFDKILVLRIWCQIKPYPSIDVFCLLYVLTTFSAWNILRNNCKEKFIFDHLS